MRCNGSLRSSCQCGRSKGCGGRSGTPRRLSRARPWLPRSNPPVRCRAAAAGAPARAGRARTSSAMSRCRRMATTPNSSPSPLGEGDQRAAMVEGPPRHAAVNRRAPPPPAMAAVPLPETSSGRNWHLSSQASATAIASSSPPLARRRARSDSHPAWRSPRRARRSPGSTSAMPTRKATRCISPASQSRWPGAGPRPWRSKATILCSST